jgi:hypothetical protein
MVSVAGYLRYSSTVKRHRISHSNKMLKLEESSQLTTRKRPADPEKRDFRMERLEGVLVFQA